MIDDRDQIAKLEALLARVLSRSRMNGAPQPPRPAVRSSAIEVPTPVAGFFPSSIPPPPAPPQAPAPQAPLPQAPLPQARPKYTSRPEVPLFAFRPPEPSHVRAVDPIDPPPMEVIELEVDPDPSIPPPPVSGPEEAFESRSRLVSAPPVALEPLDAPEPLEAQDSLDARDAQDSLDVGDEPPGHVASDPTIEVAAAEVSRAELEALEADRAPTSSRRPISMEEKMNELDDDPVPLHTPPPASGKLPTATTFELGFEAEAEISVVRAEPGPSADVAQFVGAAPRERAAKTFGELLDDALSL